MIAAKNSVHQLQDTVFVKYRNESIIIINTCVVSSVIILPFMGTLFFIFYHLSRKRQSTFHQYSFISHSIFIYCRQKFNPTAFSLLLFCVFIQGCKFEAKRNKYGCCWRNVDLCVSCRRSFCEAVAIFTDLPECFNRQVKAIYRHSTFPRISNHRSFFRK